MVASLPVFLLRLPRQRIEGAMRLVCCLRSKSVYSAGGLSLLAGPGPLIHAYFLLVRQNQSLLSGLKTHFLRPSSVLFSSRSLPLFLFRLILSPSSIAVTSFLSSLILLAITFAIESWNGSNFIISLRCSYYCLRLSMGALFF